MMLDTFEQFEEMRNNFHENLLKVDSIMKMGSSITEFTIELFTKLRRDYDEMPAFIPYKEKLDRSLNTIKEIRHSSQFREKYDILYNQGVVLIISYFESYLNDLFKWIINEFPEKIDWPEKQQKVAIDLNSISLGNPTIGEIIVNSLKGQVNFQDLQSTLRFLNDFLHLDINLSTATIDTIIKYQALRNIFIHNTGIVNQIFLKQIRETQFKADYKINNKISLEEIEYEEARSIFTEFTETIHSKLRENMIGEIGAQTE